MIHPNEFDGQLKKPANGTHPTGYAAADLEAAVDGVVASVNTPMPGLKQAQVLVYTGACGLPGDGSVSVQDGADTYRVSGDWVCTCPVAEGFVCYHVTAAWLYCQVLKRLRQGATYPEVEALPMPEPSPAWDVPAQATPPTLVSPMLTEQSGRDYAIQINLRLGYQANLLVNVRDQDDRRAAERTLAVVDMLAPILERLNPQGKPTAPDAAPDPAPDPAPSVTLDEGPLDPMDGLPKWKDCPVCKPAGKYKDRLFKRKGKDGKPRYSHPTDEGDWCDGTLKGD